jgi:hypothetical protein
MTGTHLATPELDELAHAYAVTIHRSQGSEYPAVVIPLTTSSWTMLQRNLRYTGVTRARKLIVLAGSRRALARAIRTPEQAAATPHSPTGSTPPGRRADPSARQRVRALCDVSVNGSGDRVLVRRAGQAFRDHCVGVVTGAGQYHAGRSVFTGGPNLARAGHGAGCQTSAC